MAAAASPQPSRSLPGWLIGAVVGCLVTMATPTALLLAVLLAPAFCARLLDPSPGRLTARAVMTYGAAACISPALALWQGNHAMADAWTMLTSLRPLAIAWAAQAVGWLLGELAPAAIRGMLEVGAVAEARNLRAQRARLTTRFGMSDAP